MSAPVVRFSPRMRVDLAHTTDFDLGRMRVRPSAREVELDGASERLEPRVMQVLIALCQARGAVLSRDDLVACCWAGAPVGDDAINRVMAKLRRLAHRDGTALFSLETISRVGYRLKVAASELADRPHPCCRYSPWRGSPLH